MAEKIISVESGIHAETGQGLMSNTFLSKVHAEYIELCDRLDIGKGEYGHQNYIRDEVWAHWVGSRSTLQMLLREHCEYGDNGRLVLPNLQAAIEFKVDITHQHSSPRVRFSDGNIQIWGDVAYSWIGKTFREVV